MELHEHNLPKPFTIVFDYIKNHSNAMEAYQNRLSDTAWLNLLKKDSDSDVAEYASNAVYTIKWYAAHPPVKDDALINAASNLADLILALEEAKQRALNMAFLDQLWE